MTRLRLLARIGGIVAVVLLAGPAAAQSVPVRSGEHDTFSRLVLTFPAPLDWTLSRTPDGYDLAAIGTVPRYDLRDVYRLIPRTRLGAIYSDPGSGHLRLRVPCSCHAIPFELRPGVVVIDLHDGLPPEGSSFELASDGKARLPPLGVTRPPDLRADTGRTLDWAQAVRLASRPALHGMPLFDPREPPGLAALRTDLILEIGRGASEGTVDLVRHIEPAAPVGVPGSDGAQIRIGGDANVDPAAHRRAPGSLTATGDACIADEALDIGSWGPAGPVAEAIGPARDGLAGEFDHVDPVAVRRAVRHLLSLGFGAEARMTARALAPADADRPMWEDMAAILDGDAPGGRSFEGMEVCESAAALWSVLADPSIPPGTVPRATAILSTFSGLPLHLRRSLGPPLAERFVGRGDLGTARAIRDAILRAPGDHGAGVLLMGAEIDLAQGRIETADATFAALAKGSGPESVEATIAAIAEAVRSGGPVDPATTVAMEAYLGENRGGPLEASIRDALSLAYATQHQYDRAFELSAGHEENRSAVWALLAARGTPAEIMTHGVVASGDLPGPDVARDRRMAGRLLSLGFGEAAALWVAPPRGVLADPERLLIARAQLLRRDARAALAGLDGVLGPEAQGLRADALAQLGDDGAAAALAATDRVADASRIARRTGRWAEVEELSPDTDWAAAAALLRPDPPAPVGPEPKPTDGGRVEVVAAISEGPPSTITQDTPGPIDSGRAAVAESAQARERIASLLADVDAGDPGR